MIANQMMVPGSISMIQYQHYSDADADAQCVGWVYS